MTPMIEACDVNMAQQSIGTHVLADSAAHARGIIGHHASNHAGVNGGGVRPNLVLNVMPALGLVPCEQCVDLSTNQSWLNCDAAAITLFDSAIIRQVSVSDPSSELAKARSTAPRHPATRSKNYRMLCSRCNYHQP